MGDVDMTMEEIIKSPVQTKEGIRGLEIIMNLLKDNCTDLYYNPMIVQAAILMSIALKEV